MPRILIIDDDDSLREVVRFILTEAGHNVTPAVSGEEGLAVLDEGFDLVITDIRMPGIDGMEVLARVRENPTADAPPVIVLTAHGTVEQAVEAMRLGAYTYLLKPFQRDDLTRTVEQALHTRGLELENLRLRKMLKRRGPVPGMIFKSTVMKQLVEDLQRIAPSEASVLLSGESGTGKELAARALHDLSDRWRKPFVAVNCGAIPAELMESELFGHARGAFTGAVTTSAGRVRSAAGGTLFLDEIAELPLALQPKLLRVLETRQVDPVGGTGPVQADFRLVCATNRDLEAEVAAGRFREDLLYRIKIVEITLPPLRRRPTDIPLLWEHFTLLHAGEGLVSEPDLLAELERLPWRGNVRELRNLNQRLVLMRAGDSLTLADLRRLAPDAGGSAPSPHYDDAPDEATDGEGGLPLGPMPPGGFSLIELEKEIIRRALDLCDGNRTRTAQYLGIPRHVLIYRLSKYGIG